MHKTRKSTSRSRKVTVRPKDAYEQAMRRALERKPFRSEGRYLTREEVHERARLRDSRPR